MKKRLLYWALALSSLAAMQCSDPAVEVDQKLPDLYSKEPAIYEFLNCQGFRMHDVKLYDAHVVVEGDMAIALDDIRAFMDKSNDNADFGRVKQQVVNTDRVVYLSNVLNIPYYIDASVNSITTTPAGSWESAIVTATQNWTNITNCRVSFTRVYSAASAKVKFYSDSYDNFGVLPVCLLSIGGNSALSQLPSGGQPGVFVSIALSDWPDSQGNRETVIRHELGHILGFRHDNAIIGEGGSGTVYDSCGPIYGANVVLGTPTSESTSIMVPNTGVFTNVINFSANDEKAARYLYPEGYSAPSISSITQFYKSSNTRDVRIIMTTPSVWLYRYRAERLSPWGGSVVQSFETVASTATTFWLYDVPLGTWNFRITGLNYGTDGFIQSSSQQVLIQ